MLVIRLFRVGKKNQPSFKIVVTDKRRSTRAGRFVEEVGFYNPLTKEKVLKQERLKYWISVGAKPSATIQNLLISEKITEGKKIPVHKKAKEKEKTSSAPTPAEAPVEAKRTSSSSSPSLSLRESSVKKAPENKEEKPTEEKPAQEKIKEKTPKPKEKQKEAPKE